MIKKPNPKSNNVCSVESPQEGRIGTYLHANGKVASLVEVTCKTDFAAKTKTFADLAHDLAMQVAAMGKTKLHQQKFIKDPKKTIKKVLTEAQTELGEEIKIGRLVRYAL